MQHKEKFNIINIKRKLIDLFVFYIIKKNEKFFSLTANYIPNKDFLEKILNNLQKKRCYKTEEIQKKINDIKKMSQKNKSITQYQIKIENSELKDIINFFSYYKKIFFIVKRRMNYIQLISLYSMIMKMNIKIKG